MKQTTTIRLGHPGVTQQQIADEVGVSRQLVSLVIKGEGRASEETRRRIHEAVLRLGYDSNSNLEARAMIARRYSQRAATGLLGCVYLATGESAESQLPYESHLMRGIRQAALQNGRDILLLPSEPTPGWERVDGLLVHGEGAPVVQDSLGISIPTVTMMGQVSGLGSVQIDDAGGAYLATCHLLELGHTRIAYLLSTTGAHSVQQRLLGYQRALREHGIKAQKSWVGELVNYGSMLDRGYRNMQNWLQGGWSDLGCTALLVQNDRAAIGAMTALREAGIDVPRDLSVVGFDGTDECALTVPRLTSVKVPLEEVGARAVGLLVSQMETAPSQTPQSLVLPTQLQLGDSTAAPL